MAEDPVRSSLRAHDDPGVGGVMPHIAPRPVSPLAHLGPRSLDRLARRADRYRRRDVGRFESLAHDSGVPLRHLRLLADAWAEGGRSGLRAIGPTGGGDEDVMVRADAVIETWRRRHFPLDALEVDCWRNRITVWWLTPGEDRCAELDRHPLMQLRHSSDGRWHLFRRAVQGEWWPVVVRGRRQRQSLSACLDAVRVDSLHHFWGAGGPPHDLANGDAMPAVPLADEPLD